MSIIWCWLLGSIIFTSSSSGARAIFLAASAGFNVAQAACFSDSVGYTWELNVVNDTATEQIHAGTMTNAAGVWGAGATWRKGSNSVTVGSDYGTGFHYNLAWALGSGSGPWVNHDPAGGNGTVTFSACSNSASAISSGAKPGE